MGVREKYIRLPQLSPDVERRLKTLPELFARHPIQLAYLFGSSARSPQEAEDIDLAILSMEEFRFQPFYAELSEWLGTDRLDVVDLRQAPLWLRAQVLETGVCIYARMSEDRIRWELGVRMQQRESGARRSSTGKEGAMGLNRQFLQEAIGELQKVTSELAKYQNITLASLETNLSLRWTVEHGLLAGLTLIFQIADHILSEQYGRRVDTYEGLLRELCAAGVISQSLYSSLRGSGGFRNILVHEYARIDLKQVLEAVRNAPRQFSTFVQEISEWITGQTEG